MRNLLKLFGWVPNINMTWMALFSVILFAFLFRLPAFSSHITSDPLVWINIGASLEEFKGTKAYIDYWDHKPPLLYAIYWFFYSIVGDYPASVFASSTVFFLGNVALVFFLGRRLFSGIAFPTIFSLAFTLFASAELLSYQNLGWASQYALFFETGTIFFLMLSLSSGTQSSKKAVLLAALAGLSAVLACLCKQPSALFVFVSGAFMVVTSLSRKKYKPLIGYVLGGIGSTLIISFSLFAYFDFNPKDFGEFYYQLVEYNRSYTQSHQTKDFFSLFNYRHILILESIGWAFLLPIGVAALLLARPRWRGNTNPEAVWIHLHFFATLLMLSQLISRPYTHYYIPFGLAFSYYFTYILYSSRQVWTGKKLSKAVAILSVAACFWPVFTTHKQIDQRLDTIPPRDERISVDKATLHEAIDKYGLANNYAYFEDGGMAFYHDFGLRPASRFIFYLPLRVKHAKRSEYNKEFQAEMQKNAPAFILGKKAPKDIPGLPEPGSYILANDSILGGKLWIKPAKKNH